MLKGGRGETTYTDSLGSNKQIGGDDIMIVGIFIYVFQSDL